MNNLMDINVTYYDTITDDNMKQLSSDLNEMILKENGANRSIVILCIGTDRATGDCLGPLVGEKLKYMNEHCIVLGSLSSPVHALNLKRVIKDIYENINNPLVIAIDAALGVSDHVGFITLSNSPIAPGKGVNKKLPAIGDISITGIVNVSGSNSHNLLQSTRLHTVMHLADCISGAIKYSIDYLADF